MSTQNPEDFIRGDWKNFHFRMVQPSDHDRVLNILEMDFWRDEPTLKLLGLTPEFGSEYVKVFKSFINDGLSFLAIEKETGEIAALRMIFIHSKDRDITEGITLYTRQSKIMEQIVVQLENDADIFNRFGIDEFGDLFGAYTVPKYRNQGLITESYKRALNFLRAKGYKFTKSIFTNKYTRSVALKLGFTELSRVYFENIIFPEDESKAFNPKDLTEDSYASVLGIQL